MGRMASFLLQWLRISELSGLESAANSIKNTVPVIIHANRHSIVNAQFVDQGRSQVTYAIHGLGFQVCHSLDSLSVPCRRYQELRFRDVSIAAWSRRSLA